MTQEEKAKRYDKAIEKAKAIYQCKYKPDTAAIIAETLQNIFPELKESEDERIRKALVQFFKEKDEEDFEGWVPKVKVLSWLEKQGQVKESEKFQHINETCKENGNSLTQEPVSEELEKVAKQYEEDAVFYAGRNISDFFKAGAEWQKENLWKPADGDDLPEYEREVVVFTQNYPNDAGIMSVAIAHRPNPNGWDGKSLSTGKVEHYTPKTYDKGGWNIPDVKWWLDCSMPKEIEL